MQAPRLLETPSLLCVTKPSHHEQTWPKQAVFIIETSKPLMTERFGSLGHNSTHRDQAYTNPYASGGGNYHQHQQRLFEQFANQQRQAPHRGMFGGYPSPFGGMGGYRAPQKVRDGIGPMGGYQSFGYPPHFGIGGALSQLPLSSSLIANQRYSPFAFRAGVFPRSRNPLSHRLRGYPAWPNTHRNLFPSSFLDEDDSDDDDEYSVPSVYRFPSRRRTPRGRYRQRRFGTQPRSRYWDDYDDDYNGFGGFYDEDDDDYDEYFPLTRPRRGF